MKSSTLLQAFLIFDVFVAGAVAAMALRHALAHFRPSHDAEKTHPQPGPDGHLPPAVREHLLAEAQANFEKVLQEATRDLSKDLATTSEQIREHVEKLSTEATNKELEHYKAVIADLQSKTSTDEADIDKTLVAQKAELRVKLAKDMEAEKQQLLAAIDTKLADAVTSFLMETLGHDVDLGAQGPYLTKMLEDHKADFAREVTGEQG